MGQNVNPTGFRTGVKGCLWFRSNREESVSMDMSTRGNSQSTFSVNSEIFCAFFFHDIFI